MWRLARGRFAEDPGGHCESFGLRPAGRGKGSPEGPAGSNSASRNVTPGGTGDGEPHALTWPSISGGAAALGGGHTVWRLQRLPT